MNTGGIYSDHTMYFQTFTAEFKKIVDLYQFDKPRKEIIDDYDLTSSVFHKWAVNRVNLVLLKRKTILLLTKKSYVN